MGEFSRGLKALAVTALALSLPAGAALPGFTEGAEVVRIDIVNRSIIDTISEVVYAQVNTPRNNLRQLRMTVMTVRDAVRKPCVVYFPGGGFTEAKRDKFTEARYALARAGFVVAAAEYRAVPSKFPALLEDGKAAVRYLRAHAEEFGIDPGRIGVLGDSAGGYLAQLVGATGSERAYDAGDYRDVSSAVQAVVSLYGISDLSNIGAGLGAEQAQVHSSPAVTEALLVHGPAFGDFKGASILSDPAKAAEASPISHVSGDEPPYLLLHGTADTLVSPEQSAQMYRRLKERGVDARYFLVEGAAHGDLYWFQESVIAEIVGFFEQKLGKTERGGPTGGVNL